MTDIMEGPEVVIVDDPNEEKEEVVTAPKGRGRIAEEPKPKREWPPELLEEARELIDDEYIADGGDWREDNFGSIYWLDLDHLVEFEKADKRYDSDREFWKWFREYREQNHISSKPKQPRTTWRSFGDFEYTESKHNYMTSWWSGWGYNKNAEQNQKLAIALGAVQSIVEVINDTGKRFKTTLASGDERIAPRSFTSFDDQQVVVSPQALLDSSISETEGIEVTAGWGLHEGSHIRFSTSILDMLTKPKPLLPMAVSSFLFNVLEDIRIEDRTSTQFPGFAGYFAKANSYLWDVTKDAVPDVWGPELGDKINAITAAVKWPTEFAEIVAKTKDDQLKAEFAWFTKWAETYKSGGKDMRVSLIEAMNHLREDPQTDQQLQDQQKKEEQSGAGNAGTLNPDEFRDFLKALSDMIKDSKGQKPIDTCPSPMHQHGGKSVTLTDEQKQEVEKLLREELKVDSPSIGDGQGRTKEGDKVHSRKPEETDHSRSLYIRPGPMVAKLKAAFVFRKIAPEYADRAQRTGMLDEVDLWKIAGWDTKVFERKITAEIPNTQVTLLIDLSSSMRGHRTQVAQNLANLMLECLRTMKGVRPRVRGHWHGGDGINLARIWEPGDPMTRLGLIPTLVSGSTPDGYALDWCAREMVQDQKPGEDMVLIILSDGMPNIAPGGLSGPEYVKKVVDAYAQKGVTIIQIAIASGMSADDQSAMYRHWLPFEDEQKLAVQLTRLLAKLFGGAAQ